MSITITSIAVCFAVIALSWKLAPWIKAYRDARNAEDIINARKKTQESNIRDNRDSDELRKREGR